MRSTFLYTDSEGTPQFVHNTYRDFFIAREYARRVPKGEMLLPTDRGAPQISMGARDFIREFLSEGVPITPPDSRTLPNSVICKNGDYYGAIDGREMVFVPKGPFIYSSSRRVRASDSYYLWQTTLDFFVDKYPVTNAEFRHFVDETGHEPSEEWAKTVERGKENHPAAIVNNNDARAYLSWSKKTILREDYWEKAARGVDGREYPWGDEYDQERINCASKYKDGLPQISVPIIGTMPVDAHPDGESPYGCLDICGNAWEAAAGFRDNDVVFCGGSHICADFVCHPYSRIDEIEFVSPADRTCLRLGVYVFE